MDSTEAVKSIAEAFKLPPQLLATATATVYFWPQVRGAWLRFRGGRKVHEDAKAGLELLKLRCEIEGLRRAHNLTEEEFALPPYIPPAAAESASEHVAKTRISKELRFKYGAAGAGLIVLAADTWQSSRGTSWDGDLFVLGLVLGLPAMFCAGVIAIPVGFVSRRHALVTGVIVTFAIMGLISWKG